MSVAHKVGSVDPKRSVTSFDGIRGCISVTATLKLIHFFNNKIIEQLNLFDYLGNVISYEGELDIDNKLCK